MFRKDVVPRVGKKALADVTKVDVQAILDAIEDRDVTQQAGLTFSIMRAWFNWCIGRGYLEASPIKGMRAPQKAKVRERFLSVAEIRAFWRRLPDLPMRDAERDIFRLQLLLGQRIGEVAGIMRHEVDLGRKVWTIPKERSKNDMAHEVPLPPMARNIIENAMQLSAGRFLFPRDDGKPYQPEALATRLLRAQGIIGFRKPDGSKNPFTSHDLRRTLATWLEQSGTPTSVVSLVLNHRSGEGRGVTATVYIHSDTLKAKRLALTTWEAHVRSILAGEDPFAATIDDADAIEAQLLRDAPTVESNIVAFRKVAP